MKRTSFLQFCLVMSVLVWRLPLYADAAMQTVNPKVVVATIHPLTAILREVAGCRLSIKTLLSPASSPHTFEPKPSDIREIEQAAALFYVGPHLDEQWVGRIPAASKIKMLELLPDQFMLVMQEDHHGVIKHMSSGYDTEHGVIDPHFWTDPLAVKAMLPKLIHTLSAIDPEGKVVYEQNSNRFTEDLGRLHEKVEQMLLPVRNEPVLLLHPSFQYMMNRYGLYFAGVIEFSPGKEPTPRFIMKLVENIKKLQVRALFSEIQLSKKTVAAIAEAAGIPVRELDPIGGVSGRKQYHELILYNAKALADGLR